MDDLTVQFFKCFFPAVAMNFASAEKLTDATGEQDEHALSFVSNDLLRQSQRQRYPSWGNPTETRCFPEELKYSEVLQTKKKQNKFGRHLSTLIYIDKVQ